MLNQRNHSQIAWIQICEILTYTQMNHSMMNSDEHDHFPLLLSFLLLGETYENSGKYWGIDMNFTPVVWVTRWDFPLHSGHFLVDLGGFPDRKRGISDGKNIIGVSGCFFQQGIKVCLSSPIIGGTQGWHKSGVDITNKLLEVQQTCGIHALDKGVTLLLTHGGSRAETNAGSDELGRRNQGTSSVRTS